MDGSSTQMNMMINSVRSARLVGGGASLGAAAFLGSAGVGVAPAIPVRPFMKVKLSPISVSVGGRHCLGCGGGGAFVSSSGGVPPFAAMSAAFNAAASLACNSLNEKFVVVF